MTLETLYRRLRPLLSPFGAPYALLMRQRRQRYASGRKAAYSPACACVSVGNIAWGGSGKTPLVGWLLRRLREQGLKAAVLSRGYKADPGPAPLLVQPDTAPEQAGDEALMLARAFPEAAVIAFPRRAESARYAESCLRPDVLLLDDGMQHLAVRRDLDLVLLRPEDLLEDWNRVIPAGPWREGATALAGVSAFVMKAEPAVFGSLCAAAERHLAVLGKPLFSFSLAPLGLRPLFSGENAADTFLPPERYRDQPYILLSGVGNPTGVTATAARLIGREPLRHFTYADHYAYAATDVQAVRSLFPAPLPLVCTAKDAVKLQGLAAAFGATPVWVLETEVVFGPALFTDMDFPAWWEAALTRVRKQKALAAGRNLEG